MISVIVPTRGTKPLQLDRALRSVFEQTYQDLEVIVVVDGDAQVDIQSPAILRRAPPSGGRPGLVRNVGLAVATGTLVAFLDDDDAWLPHKLETQLDRMTECCRMVCAAAVGGDAQLPPIFDRDAIARRNRIVCSSVLVAMDVVKRVGGFSDGRYGQDWQFWLRCLDVTSCAFVSTPLVHVNADAADLDRSTTRAEVRHSIASLFNNRDVANNASTDPASLVASFSGALA